MKIKITFTEHKYFWLKKRKTKFKEKTLNTFILNIQQM